MPPCSAANVKACAIKTETQQDAGQHGGTQAFWYDGHETFEHIVAAKADKTYARIFRKYGPQTK